MEVRGLLQEGEEGRCGWCQWVLAEFGRSHCGRPFTRCEVHSRDIGAVRAGPVLEVDALGVEQVLRELRRRVGLGGDGVAADACIVDQDAQALLAGLDLLHQLGDVVLARDVESAEWDDLTLDVLSVGLNDLLELVSTTTRDVDLCKVSKFLME